MSEETNTPVSLSPEYDEVIRLVQNYVVNFTKFSTKKTASAGTRARKALSELAKATKPARKAVQVQKAVNAAAKKAAKEAAAATPAA